MEKFAIFLVCLDLFTSFKDMLFRCNVAYVREKTKEYCGSLFVCNWRTDSSASTCLSKQYELLIQFGNGTTSFCVCLINFKFFYPNLTDFVLIPMGWAVSYPHMLNMRESGAKLAKEILNGLKFVI